MYSHPNRYLIPMRIIFLLVLILFVVALFHATGSDINIFLRLLKEVLL